MSENKKLDKKMVGIVAGVVLVLVVLGIVVVKLALQDDPAKRKRQIQMVTLVAPPPPPPPPEIEEPPPEPEEEVIEEPEPEDTPEEEAPEDSSDEPPPGQDLGVDAEGGAGGDSFGLVGKKGGRSLIGGGNSSMLRRFAWYTSIVQDELRDEIRKYMQDNGGLPNESLKAVVVITLDGEGRIVDHSLVKKSANEDFIKAVQHVLANIFLSEPPPLDMPKKLKLKISLKG